MQQCVQTTDIFFGRQSTFNNYHLFNKVLSYLEVEDLKLINNVLQLNHQTYLHKQLISIHHFLRGYLNRVDRFLYFSFYEEKQFKKIQQTQTLFLTNNQRIQFLNFAKSQKKIISSISDIIPSFIEKQQVLEELQRTFVNPDLPLPKLKRENEGINCKTSLQNFLVSRRSSHIEEEFPLLEFFQNLKQYYISQENSYLKNTFIKAKKNQLINLKIHSLRFTPYQITFQNIQQFLNQNCSLHNMLVYIFGLVDIWLCSAKLYLQSLTDPFHRHIQFLTRYRIYRNIILSIQENLGFLFTHYNELYSEVYLHDKPSFCFWRPALTKWLLKMEQFHEECGQVYYYCFTKLRMDNLLEGLQQAQRESPQVFMSLRNKLQLKEYEMQVNRLIRRDEGSNEIQEYFENNNELYEISAIQYVQYMVDLSINEETVHWCGHSKQFLSQPYLTFENSLLKRNTGFVKYLTEGRVQNMGQIVNRVFRIQLQLFRKLQIKPVTLYKLIDNYNHVLQYVPIIKSQSHQWEEKQEQEQQRQHFIRYDFMGNDDLLAYYNEKEGIRFALDKDEQKFYNINSVLSADELVKNSISTAIDSIYQDKQEQGQLQAVIGLIRHKSEMLQGPQQQYSMDIQQ